MRLNNFNLLLAYKTPIASAVCIFMLTACGGGGSTPASDSSVASLAPASADVNPSTLSTTTTTLTLSGATLPQDIAAQMAHHSFHALPVILPEPSNIDAQGYSSSASQAPAKILVSSSDASLTRGMSVERITQMQGVTPRVSSTGASTYTPAQIRAAYGFAPLPSPGTTMTTAQAASLGAGQTIYIVDAQHDPNAANELAMFNTKFGLPSCTTVSISSTQKLPLAQASATGGCQFSVVYSTPSGGMTSTAPSYDSGWATEIALDVQWTHATAPLARIVLIESADASLGGLVGGIQLANAMGPGVVSMSFGGSEGSWMSSVDSSFTAPNMTYLAASGDNGAGVEWPAVSSNVVAVGGTSLNWSGSGTRSETVWSGTGGGVSTVVAQPSYQTSNPNIPGLRITGKRAMSDVSMNADPSTGQYVVSIPQGSSTGQWLSVGGTSLSTPQWAGLITVANATRALNSKPPLGAPHAMLYGQIGAIPSTYTSALMDIKNGVDGSCSTCSATTGYDLPTGLGTPNASTLIPVLAGGSAPVSAPVVTPANISGRVGTPLSFTTNAVDANPLTFTMTGSPSGMTMDAAKGIVTWTTPLAGTYLVTIKASDAKTGLSGQAVYTITITPPSPPVVTAGSISGVIGSPLNFNISAQDANPLTYTLSGAPAGMVVNSSSGAVTWPTPVAGVYSVTANVTDAVSKLSAQAIYTVTIANAKAPVVTIPPVIAKVGVALTFSANVTSPNPVSWSLSSAPSGMSINATTGLISWATPVAGTYNVTIVAKDTKTGLSGQAIANITISATATTGPVIKFNPIVGKAGVPLTGVINFADTSSSSLQVSVFGVPLGMTLTPSGSLSTGAVLTLNWAAPTKGTYALTVKAIDGAGNTANATVPITIN